MLKFSYNLNYEQTKINVLPNVALYIVYIHLPKEDIETVLARDHLQHQTPPSNKTTKHLPHPEKEKVDMVWSCLQDEQRPANKTALTWTPEGNRKRVRPKTMWRRTMEEELKAAGLTWGTGAGRAQDRGVNLIVRIYISIIKLKSTF